MKIHEIVNGKILAVIAFGTKFFRISFLNIMLLMSLPIFFIIADLGTWHARLRL